MRYKAGSDRSVVVDSIWLLISSRASALSSLIIRNLDADWLTDLPTFTIIINLYKAQHKKNLQYILFVLLPYGEYRFS